MDKDAFLHQLGYAVTSNDKKLFIDIVFDLPADVIVGFTEKEFSQIVTISKQINLRDVDELFNFLNFEGLISLQNALEGVSELNNYLLSRFYYSLSISLVGNDLQTIRSALFNSSLACCKLAEMGTNRLENLGRALHLCGIAKKIFPKYSVDYAGAFSTEGLARLRLGEMGIASRENFETVILCCDTALKIFRNKNDNIYYARALTNKGTARLRLAEMNVNSRENLENAIVCYSKAKKTLSNKSLDFAGILINEGLARLRLVELGVETVDDLGNTVSLCETAQKIFPKGSSNYARALMNEGCSRLRLAEMGVSSWENLERSKRLFLESVSIFEELGDGWSYSVALLNLNNMLKENFYKTGDKKCLEEWEGNLGDIENKVKDRDILYKELLIVKIHEIRASLLELDGKQGISDASFEYYEAYKLSKDPFYKFMKEFCQARSDNKSFCKIVSDWKEEEKKGIFLDYYDYTVFECHLENALKKSIFRKEELELARQKLEEIGSRTQIKIIKDRVAAYVFLMNSLDFCFEQGSYEDAAENVLKAYNIFLKYDDKPGCEMCECFNEALQESRNPESWRNVVQKILQSGEFSSNFYRLLCNYSDRKRTNILQDLPFQTLEKTSRIEEKVDNIQKTLDQINADCVSIKDQIEEGLEVTAAELRQIKGKINDIQQNLGNLVKISNDIGGKEGECIRKFASQMLELMKKGDYEALKRFSEKIIQNSSSFEEIIEAAEIPEKEKAEAKSKLADLKKIPGIVKDKTKSFSVDVTKDVVITLTSNEIIKFLTPVLSTAIFDVPIPSKLVEILLEAIRNS
mgnify:CR=1 FL=1